MQSSLLPRVPTTTVFHLLTLTLSLLLPLPSLPLSLCGTSCGPIPVAYPFAVDDGCGSPSFRRMLSCNASDLFFTSPSGAYKVQSIDYAKRKVVVYDPAMSTCSILQPHHDFALTDVQAALIPPSDDTIFAVLNCSIDSPVVNHFKYLCSPDVGGHSCSEMYGACASFRIFRSAAPQGANQSSPSLSPPTSPPCCFTRYATLRFMSMNMLDCTHYTTVIDSGGLEKSGPLDWTYGIELTYAVPESTACDRCKRSGGACGFDTESEAMLCLCSPTLNATVECAAGTGIGSGQNLAPTISVHTTLFIILSATIYTNLVWGFLLFIVF